jgi:hypothetical protein
MHSAIRAVVLTIGLCACTQVLSAQVVTGIVTVIESGEALAGANIMLEGAQGQANVAGRSDERGEFLLEARSTGAYYLIVNYIGFKPASTTVLFQAGDTVDVQVSMVPVVSELEPLTVYGRRLTREQLEFESRKKVPWGYWFNRAAIDNLKYAARVMDIVEQGVPLGSDLARSRGGMGRCYGVYLDGREFQTYKLSEYPISWLYGMEVYIRYEDIPLKYRNPFYVGRNCGAILLWSNLTRDGSATPTYWTGAVGIAPGIRQWFAEVTWRPGIPDEYVTVARVRAGTYSPYGLLGTDVADDAGFYGDVRPRLFVSTYVGKQGPAPLLQWKDRLYLRIAPGGTVYLGGNVQRIEADGTTINVGQISPFFGFGAELALGYRVPAGKVRPWLEARTGSEYITRTGIRWLSVAVSLGLEVEVGGIGQ